MLPPLPFVPRRYFAQALDRWPSRASLPTRQTVVPKTLDAHVLHILNSTPAVSPSRSLYQLLEQYHVRAHTVLNSCLKYEPAPAPSRRVQVDSPGVVGLSHVVDHGHEHKVSFCSGFALHVEPCSELKFILSCAHTLEEMERSSIVRASLPSQHRSGTLIFYKQGGDFSVARASDIITALPKSDLVVFSSHFSSSFPSLPVSPYPVPPGSHIRAHFVSEEEPIEPGWLPWVNGTWHKWVKGHILEYRGPDGRKAEPGTYDTLSHLLFHPAPSFGSSGGPIVDEESGAIVGVVLGTRMDHVEKGIRGWGVPAEAIFGMFKLPGMNLR